MNRRALRDTCRPFRAWVARWSRVPGRCPGLSHLAPLGHKRRGLVLALVLAAYVLDESPFSVFFALKDHHVRCLHLDQFPN